jgi:hypothetical protein
VLRTRARLDSRRAQLLANWHRLNRRGIVLSWSNNAGGNGHVNLRTNEWVEARLASMGYSHDTRAEAALRRAVSDIHWFRDTRAHRARHTDHRTPHRRTAAPPHRRTTSRTRHSCRKHPSVTHTPTGRTGPLVPLIALDGPIPWMILRSLVASRPSSHGLPQEEATEPWMILRSLVASRPSSHGLPQEEAT